MAQRARGRRRVPESPRLATDQANRVARVLDDGLGAMALDGHAFLAVAMVPTGLGSMMIDAARVAAIGRWVAELGEPNYFEGFFHPTVSPTAGVRAHRVTLKRLWETDRRPDSEYAELFDDGTGFACT